MLKFTTLLLHVIRIAIMLCKQDGVKALMAENIILRKQLLNLSRKSQGDKSSNCL
jgi:hypothetical protein